MLYFYFLDRDFGLMHVRLETWFPYTTQVYVNGHDWLARQLAKRGLGFVQHDSCFTKLDDPQQAQRFADRFAQLNWVKQLSRWARQVNPHVARGGWLREQEPEKQGRLKLSYYAIADELHELQAMIGKLLDEWFAPYSLIHSIDPFNGDGLIDVLPRGVSKVFVLSWWSRHVGISHEAVVYAGDSGNDLAAFTAGYRTIVVGNAARSLCKQVRDSHQQAGWHSRLFVAQAHATRGVLAGCRMFGLIDNK